MKNESAKNTRIVEHKEKVTASDKGLTPSEYDFMRFLKDSASDVLPDAPDKDEELQTS